MQVSIVTVGYISRTLVGKVRVPLVEVAAAGVEGFRRMLPLMNENYEVFREPRGEVDLTITWTFDPEAATKSGLFSWAALKKKKVRGHDRQGRGRAGLSRRRTGQRQWQSLWYRETMKWLQWAPRGRG